MSQQLAAAGAMRRDPGLRGDAAVNITGASVLQKSGGSVGATDGRSPTGSVHPGGSNNSYANLDNKVDDKHTDSTNTAPKHPGR